MKRIILTLILCGAGLKADGSSGKHGQRVTVYVYDKANLPADVLWRSTSVASGIFEAIGVHIQWKSGKPHPPGSDQDECVHADERTIAVTILPFASMSDSPGRWAIANLRTGAITMYYDRIRHSLTSFPHLVATCIGYTLAHEVAHVLQDVGRHADSGILKAQWGMPDYRAMEEGILRFTPADIRLIQYGAVSQFCPVATEVSSQ